MRRPAPSTHYLRPRLRTPFHPRIAALMRANDWCNWAGYEAPTTIEDDELEYFAIRNACSLFDLSPMTKYRIAGPDAEAYLDRLTLRDVSKLKPGRVQYTAWCEDEGKVLDDGTLFRLGSSEFRLCCQERHLDWLLDTAIGFDVAIADATEEIAALALQGPASCAALRDAGFAGIESLKPFQIRDFPLGASGRTATVSRTGFSGDLGYELFVGPEDALALWDRLWDAGQPHRLRAIGYAALDIARIEAGFLTANSDFITAEHAVRVARRRSPFELGLDWMVDFAKARHFNGRNALASEQRDKTSRHILVGLDVEGDIPAEHSLVYHRQKTEIGHVTAATWSPTLKRNIAIATLRRPFGESVTSDLWIEIYALRELVYHKLMVRAQVAARPFFNPPRRWATPPADY